MKEKTKQQAREDAQRFFEEMYPDFENSLEEVIRFPHFMKVRTPTTDYDYWPGREKVCIHNRLAQRQGKRTNPEWHYLPQTKVKEYFGI